MKRIFILSILLTLIVYNLCGEEECTSKVITEGQENNGAAICGEVDLSSESKECAYDAENKKCVPKAKESQPTPATPTKSSSKQNPKDSTQKKETKSSSDSSMIKISLFLLISMLFI